MNGNPPSRKAATSLAALANLALLTAWTACATTSNGPMDSRTLPEEKRYEFLKAKGSEMSQLIRNAFIDGQVTRGMPREWVLELFGRPDGVLEGGWEYRDRKGEPVLEIFFDQDTVDSIVTFTRTGTAPGGDPGVPWR